MSQKKLTGAQILMRCLREEKVDLIFGYPGGAVLVIYDELFKQKEIRHILVRHEQGAAHAADAYARATGKPGVCLVTSGPGVTNAVTGIATAYMDSIPLVVISGQVPSHAIGLDAFQEVDTVGITRPCTKYNILVSSPEGIAPAIKKAFHVAVSGRPGPVLVDIPKDVTMQEAEYQYPRDIELRSYRPTTKGHPGQIKRALALIKSAQRPMIYSGGGVILANAAPDLVKFARALGAPVTNTLMGLGRVSGRGFAIRRHARHARDIRSQYGDATLRFAGRRRRALRRPSHRQPGTLRPRKTAHYPYRYRSVVDFEAGARRCPDRRRCRAGAARSQPRARKISHRQKTVADWWRQVEQWRAKNCLRYRQKAKQIMPQAVVEELYRATAGDAIVTSDVGQHQMWAAQYYKFAKPRRWINSGGLGTMGFGLPAAVGAQLAFPKARVACVTGEASIIMCLQELSTCKQYRLPIKIVNLNNRYMGMVRQWQEFFHGNRYSESYMNALPDFVRLAESYGHIGMRIEAAADVRPALEEAFARKNDLVFMDFVTDQKANVYPMVAAGKGLSEMVLAEDL